MKDSKLTYPRICIYFLYLHLQIQYTVFHFFSEQLDHAPFCNADNFGRYHVYCIDGDGRLLDLFKVDFGKKLRTETTRLDRGLDF